MKNAQDLAAIELSARVGQADEKTGKQVRAVVIGGDGKARNVVDPDPVRNTGGHAFAFSHVNDDNQAEFVCPHCLQGIAFALPGEGNPAAVDLGNGEYGPDPDYGIWAGVCAHLQS